MADHPLRVEHPAKWLNPWESRSEVDFDRWRQTHRQELFEGFCLLWIEPIMDIWDEDAPRGDGYLSWCEQKREMILDVFRDNYRDYCRGKWYEEEQP